MNVQPMAYRWAPSSPGMVTTMITSVATRTYKVKRGSYRKHRGRHDDHARLGFAAPAAGPSRVDGARVVGAGHQVIEQAARGDIGLNQGSPHRLLRDMTERHPALVGDRHDSAAGLAPSAHHGHRLRVDHYVARVVDEPAQLVGPVAHCAVQVQIEHRNVPSLPAQAVRVEHRALLSVVVPGGGGGMRHPPARSGVSASRPHRTAHTPGGCSISAPCWVLGGPPVRWARAHGPSPRGESRAPACSTLTGRTRGTFTRRYQRRDSPCRIGEGRKRAGAGTPRLAGGSVSTPAGASWESLPGRSHEGTV